GRTSPARALMDCSRRAISARASGRLIVEQGPSSWPRRRPSSHQKAIQFQPPPDWRFCRLPCWKRRRRRRTAAGGNVWVFMVPTIASGKRRIESWRRDFADSRAKDSRVRRSEFELIVSGLELMWWIVQAGPKRNPGAKRLHVLKAFTLFFTLLFDWSGRRPPGHAIHIRMRSGQSKWFAITPKSTAW